MKKIAAATSTFQRQTSNIPCNVFQGKKKQQVVWSCLTPVLRNTSISLVSFWNLLLVPVAAPSLALSRSINLAKTSLPVLYKSYFFHVYVWLSRSFCILMVATSRFNCLLLQTPWPSMLGPCNVWLKSGLYNMERNLCYTWNFYLDNVHLKK